MYQNKKVHLCGITIAECNKPSFQDTLTDDDIDRLILIDFPSEYSDESTTNMRNILKDDKYRDAMMYLLIDTYHKYNGQIYLPESIKKQTQEYFSKST